MNPTDEEIDRVARLLHEAGGEWLRINRPTCPQVDPFEAISDGLRQRYRHAALTVLNDLWSRWNPTTGGPT